MDQSKLLQVAYYDREAYEQLTQYGLQDTFQGPAKILWDEIESYYTKDSNATRCDGEVLVGRATRKNEKAGKVLATIIRDFNSDISIPNLTQEILEAKKYNLGLELASLLTSPSADKQTIIELMEQYEAISSGIAGDEDEVLADVFTDEDGLDDLAHTYDRDNLFPLFPKALNDHVDGGVPPQTNVAIFARPEYGKSMVSINMAYGFAKAGKRTLYVGNEDSHSEMRLRLLSRFTGRRKIEVLQDLQGTLAIARERGWANLVFASATPGTPAEVDGLIQRYGIEATIVDQIRNLDIKGADGLVVQLERASKSLRAIGKKNNQVMVQVTQAGDSATNKLVLDYTDVDNSKTGFPAAFDVMIGVGANEAFRANNERMLSLCKNKINNDHSYFKVRCDPTLSKVISL